MKKWKQRGFAFVLALSLTTGLLTGAQAAVSKETLNAGAGPERVRCTGQLLSGLLCHCGDICEGLRRQAAR